MRITMAGSSGLIGTALAARFRAKGHEITRLVRSEPADAEELRWDPTTGQLPSAAVDGADVVVNLAGAGIGDHRWTDAYKQLLTNSRLQTTELLASTVAKVDRPPASMLSASAIGFYGPRGDEELDENSPPGTGFLSEMTQRWEDATGAASVAGVRTVLLRTGIVLSPHGGALRKQLPLFKLGLGGRLGSGRQWQSWISIDDEVRAIEHLLDGDVAGPVNLTTPNPVTGRQFAKTLGAVLRRPAILPIPSLAPKLLLGGELTEALLLTGQRVLPKALVASGYAFQQPTLEGALRALLGR